MQLRLNLFAVLVGALLVYCACQCLDDDEYEPCADDDASDDDVGDDDTGDDDIGDDDADDDDSAVSHFTFFEDFERGEVDLEHDYPSYDYEGDWIQYMHLEENWDRGGDPEVVGFFVTSHSTVYGLAFAGRMNWCDWDYDHCFGEEHDVSGSYDYARFEGPAFDLTTCESGHVTFTWGFDDLSYNFADDDYVWPDGGREYIVYVAYGGMGTDDSVKCTGESYGEMELHHQESEDMGPHEVVCPIDYDCGYEEEGSFSISLYIEIRAEAETHDGYDYTYYTALGGLLWIDDIGVYLE